MITVINLFAGSGAGKSTTAALLYAKMKLAGIHYELVREYVKNWVWNDKKIKESDQLYLLGKQSQYESLLYNQVDYIITDSPVLLSGAYQTYYTDQTYCTDAALSFLEHSRQKGVNHLNLFINRTKKFDNRGRYNTEEEAIVFDSYLKNFLKEKEIPFIELFQTDEARVDEIQNILIRSKGLI